MLNVLGSQIDQRRRSRRGEQLVDGVQIALEIAKMISPYDGIRISLWISLVTAAAVGVLGFQLFGMFIGIMFAYFAIMNWQMLQGPWGGGGGFGGGGGRPW